MILWHCGPTRAMASSFLRFVDHTWHITVSRTPLDKWPAHHRDLYLTTHNTHNRQISMPLVGSKPTISAGEQPQTYALDRAATGTCFFSYLLHLNFLICYVTKLFLTFVSITSSIVGEIMNCLNLLWTGAKRFISFWFTEMCADVHDKYLNSLQCCVNLWLFTVAVVLGIFWEHTNSLTQDRWIFILYLLHNWVYQAGWLVQTYIWAVLNSNTAGLLVIITQILHGFSLAPPG